MLREAVKRISEAARGDGELSIVDLVQTPAQREIVDRITAVMSLLEGHADVVMDGVGPDVIGSIVEIRRRFNVRRQGQGFDKIIRKLLGLDAKMRQYRDGAAFCKAVIAAVGMDGLNRVWTSPETLPTKAEIADPQIWLDRMDSHTTHPEVTDGHDADGVADPMRTSPPHPPTEQRSADGSACARSRDADPGPGRRGGAGRRGPLPAGGVLRWSRLAGPGPGGGARRPPPSASASPRSWSTTACSRRRPTRQPPLPRR